MDNAEEQYVFSRLRRFFPIVAVQAVVLLTIELIFFQGGLGVVVGTLCQLSFVNAILPKSMINNATMWFLSAYIISGAVTIYIAKRMPLFKKGGAFIACAMIYNYLINSYGNIDVWWQLDFAGTLQCALPRAFAGISLGYFVRGVYEKMKTVSFL